MSNKERRKMEKEMNVVFTVESEEERKAKEEKKAKRKLKRKTWWSLHQEEVVTLLIVWACEACCGYLGYKTGFARGQQSVNGK